MCDTLGKLHEKGAFFAKNSDRSPNEVQRLEYHPACQGLSGMVQCTYIAIPQAGQTHAVLLSRPGWMWGAEMGVNEWGLCIGNEAVFTKGAYGKLGLTGMDMVRLALERCCNAREALELLIRLLEEYGQGGNCGFDHDFFYDNAFLILDRNSLYVLETAGKQWVYKRGDAANISNRLSIGADGDGYSGGKAFDFRKKYTEPVYTTFSGSGKRLAQVRRCLPGINTLTDCMGALRQHDEGVKNPFCQGSVSSACMHYGGLVGDHSTASMAVSVEEGKTVVWSTGSSVPCVSLFKPWCFGTEKVLPVTGPNDPAGEKYWQDAERFRRSLLGKVIPEEYYAQRDSLESSWLVTAQSLGKEAFGEFSRACLAEEKAFYDTWKGYSFADGPMTPGFRKRWNQKSEIFFTK